MPKLTAAIPSPYAERIAAVRADLAEKQLTGYLVQSRTDQYWLTGFTGEDGAVLLTASAVVLLTDGRFDEAADLEAPYARKVVRKKRGPEATVRELKRCRITRLGFDPDQMTVQAFTQLRKLAKSIRFVPAAGLITIRRQIKDAGEVEAIRRAIRIAEQAFEQLRRWVQPGMTEREVAARLVYEMQQLGAQGPSFTPIVAVGANSSLPHYEPGEAKVVAGQPLLVDWGARAGWYVSDLTRTLVVGSIDPRLSEIVKIVREAHDRSIAVIRPGVKASAVDRAARDFIRKSGYGKQFNHSVGHGIGLEVHEGPGLRKIAKEPLKPGMVVTVEPGIYLPGVGGARIEDDVLVTETGYEVLSSLPAEYPAVG